MSRPVDPARAERNRRIVAQHRRIEAIVDTLAERLPADELTRIRSDLRAGEYTLALDVVLAILVKGGIAVSRAEHRALAEAVDYYEQPVEYMTFTSPELVAALVVRDPAPGGE
jgi:uroporphyrinogen-III synthase